MIEDLIRLAKEMEAVQKPGEQLGLTDDEIAFYDALATIESTVIDMGDDKRKVIVAELIKMVRRSVTIDWTPRETARANIRVIAKRILKKWGYSPDLPEEAVKTVLQRVELLCADYSDLAVCPNRRRDCEAQRLELESPRQPHQIHIHRNKRRQDRCESEVTSVATVCGKLSINSQLRSRIHRFSLSDNPPNERFGHLEANPECSRMCKMVALRDKLLSRRRV